MGGLKEQDLSIGSTEPVKRKRGNPNLTKGKRNPYYETTSKNNMAENTEEQQTQATPQQDDGGVKKTIPDDLFSDVIPEQPVLPLDGEVKTKDYATIKDASTGGNGAGPTANTGGTNTPPPPPGTDTPPIADGASQTPPMAPGGKSPEEIRTEAEQMVKLILRGYEKLHGVGRWVGKVDDKELMQLHMSKKIDLDFQLPLGNKNVAVREFFDNYNREIDENIVVTDEFKEAVTPPLVRIAIKRGWSMGDEMYVMMLAAEDLGTKMSILMGLKKSANLILDACMNIQKAKNTPPQKKETANENPNINPEDHWREAPHQTQDVNYEEVK